MENIEKSVFDKNINDKIKVDDAEIDNSFNIQISNELIFDEHRKIAQENIDRMQVDKIRSELSEDKENSLTPEEILIHLSKYCEKYMSAPTDAVMDGNFADPARKLVVENGDVVLIRHRCFVSQAIVSLR